jgi:hypothetical protein
MVCEGALSKYPGLFRSGFFDLARDRDRSAGFFDCFDSRFRGAGDRDFQLFRGL